MPHNIEFNQNIIDENTSTKINEAVEEINKTEAENEELREKIRKYVEAFNKREENKRKENEELLKSGMQYLAKMHNSANININNNNNFNNFIDNNNANNYEAQNKININIIDDELPPEKDFKNNDNVQNVNNDSNLELPGIEDINKRDEDYKKQEKIFKIIILNKFGLLKVEDQETINSLSEIEKMGSEILSYSKENYNKYDFESELFKTTWPKEIKDRFFKNIELLRKSFVSEKKNLIY